MPNYGDFLKNRQFGRKDDDTQIPVAVKSVSVDIDDISFFSLNPRRSENPEYDNIKESIRAIGLENPLTITKRPGDAGYTLYNGGNTRLKALKELWRETGDEKYHFLDCRLVPYQSDTELLIRHMIENETRGDMLLVDKAVAAFHIKKMTEDESGTSLSTRKLADLLTERGWPVKQKTASLFVFVAEHLAERIPLALNAGMGRPKIESIRKTYHAVKKYVDERLKELDSITGDEAQLYYLDALALHDDKSFLDSYPLDEVCTHIESLTDIDAARVRFEIMHIYDHGEVYQEASTLPGVNDLGQYVEEDAGDTETNNSGTSGGKDVDTTPDSAVIAAGDDVTAPEKDGNTASPDLAATCNYPLK